MSADMTSSSICVGTSTVPRESSRVVDHSRERYVVTVDTLMATTVSGTDGSARNDETGASSFANDVAAVADMDLVNAPNPWLPAYGFQLQQHTQHFQPTHEDLRANDPALAQQGDFLETILEETSDDLQSDSDRSGTTYWLGSDSETESVIHIKAVRRAVCEIVSLRSERRRDGSSSECNSVVPKKRRRRNTSNDRDATIVSTEDHWTSPRSSRSSESSSRSSSLLQFESLERTCATVSPSGYSYDSLEYSNRSNSHFENTSPDSLDGDRDDDDDEAIELRRSSRLNGFPVETRNGFGKLRPYRSFESLDTCHKDEALLACNDLSNGFSASFYSKTSHDLSAGTLKNDRGRRDFWHENYEEDEYEYEDDEVDEDEEDGDDEDTIVNRESRVYDPYEDEDRDARTIGASSFGDSNNLSCYSTSLDFRNTIDLREIGLDTGRDTVYDLKSGQASATSSQRGIGGLGNTASSRLLQTTRLNIAGFEEVRGLVSPRVKMASNALTDRGSLLHHRHHHNNNNNNTNNHNDTRDSRQNKRGWCSSDWSDFNFRSTEKSLSAPSLSSDFDVSASSAYASANIVTRKSGAAIGTVSSTSLFENYTRVASIPVDLNLCGRDDTASAIRIANERRENFVFGAEYADEAGERLRIHEMADDSVLPSEHCSYESNSRSTDTTDSSRSSDHCVDTSEDSETIRKVSCVRTSSVRTQIRPEITGVKSELARTRTASSKYVAENVAKTDESASSDDTDEISSDVEEDKGTLVDDTVTSLASSTSRDSEPPRSTVKTQDRGNGNVLGLAIAMENDIDAVVDEAIRQFKREVEEATGPDTVPLTVEDLRRLANEKQQRARRVKNNASYELAQQFEINEHNLRRTGFPMSSCVEDERETPSSPNSSNRRRVLNNASYELAQQTDYMKMLQKNANRPFQRMDACDERAEVPRSEINCGRKVADIVRELSPGTSSIGNSTLAGERSVAVDGKAELSPNHVTHGGGKNHEEQQQETMLDQIKKNSDLFSRYGEGGREVVGGLVSVGTNHHHDDEVDYPCLEIKSIIDYALVTVSGKDTRRNISADENVNEDASCRNERGLSFIGDFYPETKLRLAKRTGSPVVASTGEYATVDTRDSPERSLEDDGSKRSAAGYDDTRRNEETVDDTAGPHTSSPHVPKRRSSFSSSPTPVSSSSSPCKSDPPCGEGRDSADSIQPVAPEPTASLTALALERERGHWYEAEAEEEEEASSSNSSDLGKEKEASRRRRRRRKERACVETGEASPNGTASCVHASTPATSSPPRLITRVSVNRDSDEPMRNGPETKQRESDENTCPATRHEEHEIENEHERDTRKTRTSNDSAEMSASAAKRLAMASGPTRNNERTGTIVNKHEVIRQRNVSPAVHTGSPVNERKKGGLGGFLQRFSRLRFSGRSKVPRSDINKKFTSESTSADNANGRTNIAKAAHEERSNTARRKEPDYIIIPLHAPEDECREADDRDLTLIANKPRRSVDLERSASCASPNGRPLVSSKPPLPPSHHPSGGSLGSGGGGGGARQTGATTPTTRCGMSAGVTVGNTRRRAATDLGSPAAIEMAKARTMQQAAQEPRPVGLLETDLDAAEPAIRHVNLSNANIGGASANGQPHSAHVTSTSNNQAGKKTRSLLNLNHTSTRQGRELGNHLANENELRVPHSPGSGNRNSSEHHHQDHHNSVGNQRPHKSMEFLLDKENLHFVKPPENELQKVGERVPSEHELRVQRSLQRLNVPDWYKNSPAARDGFRLKRHSDASQHSGWRSLGSKTTSLSSLSSSSNRQPTTGVLLSPSPTPPVFSRWSTSLLNSAGSSPASSARSSFNHRQPYLGWRSQERIANPRTPAERLAQGILPQLQSTKKQQQHQQQQQQTNQQLEVRNSIKEVTSAIVHYVQSGQEVAGGGRLSPRPRPDDWDDRGGARSTSPRGSVKLCWMESSFVGSRPVDSPETPMSLATDTECCAGCNATGTESCSCVDSATSGLYLDLTPTRDEPQQRQRSGQQQYQEQQQQQQQSIQHHGTRSQCPSPTPTLNYHQQIHHHAHQQQQQQYRHHRGSGQSEDEEAMATAALLRNKPSPGSTTLEDVLDSLLGLPSASRTPSPGPGPLSGSTLIRHHRTSNTGSPAGQTTNTNAGKSCSDLRQDLQESARIEDNVASVTNDGGRTTSRYTGELVRRKSEGSDIVAPNRSSSRAGTNARNRRVSFDGGQQQQQQQHHGSLEGGGGIGTPLGEKLVRCRNNKCNNATTVAEARRVYKSCHNCTCLYCSRECRRAHWQRHRRICLHSRAGTLCRQVLSSAKEDPVTLKHISALAQRGYATHGRGAVKCFFTSPEIAEQFVSNGFVDLGEPTYVKWSELLPSEMGAELYAEVMRLCKSYNPETRLVLYVAVCVVSEVPSSGAVRWERQLVSRCGKIRLDSSCRQATIPPATPSSATSPSSRVGGTTSPCNITREMDSPETLVLTSTPGTDGQNTPRSSREIGFTNIQRQLRLRGVSLRRHFPQVYTKLCSYVDGSVDKFAPVTIYPRDQASGKSFMCIIMLDAEPERLQLLPTDSSRVRTVDISVEQE